MPGMNNTLNITHESMMQGIPYGITICTNYIKKPALLECRAELSSGG